MDLYRNEQIFANLGERYGYEVQMKVLELAHNKVKEGNLKLSERLFRESQRNRDFELEYLDSAHSVSKFNNVDQSGFIDLKNVGNQDDQVSTENLKFLSSKNLIKYNYSEEVLYHINKLQFHELDQNNITHFPLYTTFKISSLFLYRRYNSTNEFHICDECSNVRNSNEIIKLTCSSNFRQIDKIRLVYLALKNTIDIEGLNNEIKLDIPNNEHKLSIDQQTNISENNSSINALTRYTGYENKTLIFKDVISKLIIIRNTNEHTKDKLFSYDNIIHSFLNLFNDQTNTNLLNNGIKNIYGEAIGLYYYWLEYVIKCAKIPALVGVIYLIALFILNSLYKDKNLGLRGYFTCFLCLFYMFWIVGCKNIWEGKESFYRFAWGVKKYTHNYLNNSLTH